MTHFTHPSYSKVLSEILSDEYTRYLEASPRTSFPARETPPAFSDTSWKKTHSAFEFSPFAYGTLLGVGAVVCTWLILGFSKSEPMAAEIRAPQTPVENVQIGSNLRTERLESEMELVKKIVVGLVESVEELSNPHIGQGPGGAQPFSPTVTSEKAMLPFPVEVVAEKANLRSSPDLKGQTVAEVPKKTVLLAVDQQDSWLKVTTPKGTEAWVHRTVVTESGGS